MSTVLFVNLYRVVKYMNTCAEYKYTYHACIMVAMLVAIADREVQRILLELFNQMDGFNQNVNGMSR